MARMVPKNVRRKTTFFTIAEQIDYFASSNISQ